MTSIRFGWKSGFALLGVMAAAGCSGATLKDDERPTERVALNETEQVASSAGEGEKSASNEASCGTENWWRTQRDERQRAFDAFLTGNAEAFRSFKNAALGTSGIPMVMIRLFPELFPEIWGTADEHMERVGFREDTLEPGRVLPLGLGYIGSSPAVPTPAGPVNVNVVNLTCMGCHAGVVRTPTGERKVLPGAPNNQFDGFRQAVFATVNDPRYTADAFRTALAAKPVGWVYGDPSLAKQETLERAIFMAAGGAEQFLAKLKQSSLAGAARFAATLVKYTYAAVPNPPDPNGRTPGSLDAISTGVTTLTDPAVMTPEQLKAALPPAPAPIDIMSVWRQADRPAAQWDGSIVSQLHRNLGAEFGVIGDPTKLNMENALLSTALTQELPAPPYPFDVDRAAAARGRHLFKKYCASCHTAGSDAIFPADDVGTDPNRANLWTPFSVAGLQKALSVACTDPIACKNPDGTPVAPEKLARKTGGYMALPLDGIWARAPYLHNGSVPTLAALLTNERPAKFYRGTETYDEGSVGFTWDKPAGVKSTIFDTTRSGNSNGGHDTPEYLGDVDWKHERGKLRDLLEYMKTL